MTCIRCGNEMRIVHTDNHGSTWLRDYLCDYCGKQKNDVPVHNPK